MSSFNQELAMMSSEDVDVFSLHDIISSMNMSHVNLTNISDRNLSHSMQVQFNCKKRFNVCIWRNISKAFDDERYKLSVNLLNRIYGFTVVAKSFELLQKQSCEVMIISILGYYSTVKKGWYGSKDELASCIGCVVCFKDLSSFIISHLAVSDFNFSTQHYGTNCDGGSFRGRGLAKVLISVCQYYLRNQEPGEYTLLCYPHRQNLYRGNCKLWHEMGCTAFQEVAPDGIFLSQIKPLFVDGHFTFLGGAKIIPCPLPKFHLDYILDTTGSHVAKQATKSDWRLKGDKAVSFSDKVVSYSDKALSYTPPNKTEVDIRLYVDQLSQTVVRIEKIPESVFSRDETSMQTAVQYAIENVSETYNKRRKQSLEDRLNEDTEEDDSRSENEDWKEEWGNTSDQESEEGSKENYELSEVKRFLKGLEHNLVFDLGYRSDQPSFQNCWCPW